MGVFHSKGWWSKSSCPPSIVCLPWVWKGGTWDVPGILPGCPRPLGVFKKFVQNSLCAVFVPYKWKTAQHMEEARRFSGTFRNHQPLVISQKHRRYNWEAYCGTNRRCIAVQIGGLLRRFLSPNLTTNEAQRYKWGEYCGTNWRCTASTFQTCCAGCGGA